MCEELLTGIYVVMSEPNYLSSNISACSVILLCKKEWNLINVGNTVFKKMFITLDSIFGINCIREGYDRKI
jgi:hypothetical protein